ncbi:MAG TPA: tetratricopeptide repeat protein [Bryobacteraceae bacterium]|nr:tetratricopeptide repeat protein [Bryobacteraceae bacterium]
MARLDALKEMVEQSPADSRVRFMLAMEYSNSQRFAEAKKEFDELIMRDPSYVSAYFMASRVCEAVGDLAGARGYLEVGIETARKVGDRHAESEMQEALGLLD